MICVTQTTDWPQASCKNQNSDTNVITITLLNFILLYIIIWMGLCFRYFIEYLLFSTQVHSDWLTNFGQTSVKFKVYSFCRYLVDNQIEELPFEVFNNNLELTYLWVINYNFYDCIDYPYIRVIYKIYQLILVHRYYYITCKLTCLMLRHS